MSIELPEDWRVVEDFPQYEINKDGDVRKSKNRKLLNTSDGHRQRIRVRSDGFKLSVPVRYIRNEAFPELTPW